MLRTIVVRRAGRLLGAVTVAGVLSVGALATAPAQLDARSQLNVLRLSSLVAGPALDGAGLSGGHSPEANGLRAHSLAPSAGDDANGI